MTTTVFETATFQQIREELLKEILTLIKATSGEPPYKPANHVSSEEREFLMSSLIDEYSNKL